MYIPDGFGTVFPYIVVDDPNGFLTFLENVFGAAEVGRTELPDGRVANVRVRIGTSVFMVSQASGQMNPMPSAYYIYVEDVDGTYSKAGANGASSLFEPMDMPYEDRQAGVEDPFGNIWWISRRLVERPYDE